MAVGEVRVAPSAPRVNFPQPKEMLPVSAVTNWVDVNTAPETADNSGSTVTSPALLTRSDLLRLNTSGLGPTVQLRLKYNSSITGPTNPVVQPFGIDANDAYSKLYDANGDHELTITVDTTSDVVVGGFKYTAPIDVALAGNRDVLCAIKTAFAGTGTVDTSTIQARVISRPVTPPIEANVNAGSLATAANQATGNASLSVLDDWDLADACKSVALQKSVTGTNNSTNTIAAAGDYAANDIISNSASNGAGVAWHFAGALRGNGYTGTAVGFGLATSVEAFAARVRFHLFNAAPTTATELDDNAAFYIDLDDRAKYLGYVDLPASADFGEFSFAQVDGIAKKLTGDNNGDVWAIIQLLDAVTNEAASMSVWPTLHVVQD